MNKIGLAIKIADTLSLYYRLKRKWILEHNKEKSDAMERCMLRTKDRIRKMIVEYEKMS